MNTFSLVGLALSFLGLGFAIGSAVGRELVHAEGVKTANKTWETECVKRRVARWGVTGPGTTTFVWRVEDDSEDEN